MAFYGQRLLQTNRLHYCYLDEFDISSFKADGYFKVTPKLKEKATRERIKLFPEYEKLIIAYYGRWEKMLGGEISGTVKILNTIYQKSMQHIR